jgi:hypothetical protein
MWNTPDTNTEILWKISYTEGKSHTRGVK